MHRHAILLLLPLIAGCEYPTIEEQREEVEAFAARNVPAGGTLQEITKYGLRGSGGSRLSYPFGTEYIYEFRGRCYLVKAAGGHAGLKTQEVNCQPNTTEQRP